MTERHILHWLQVARLQSSMSRCARRQMGCVLVDPATNLPISLTYNGGPAGGGQLCGGDFCRRDLEAIPSGERVEVGCHHAEANAIAMCASAGRPTRGAWAFVTGEPCALCAKLLHHAGIARVVVVDGGYAGANGVDYLVANGIDVERRTGPRDPRSEP